MCRDPSTPDRVWMRGVERRRSRRWAMRPTCHGAPHTATSSGERMITAVLLGGDVLGGDVHRRRTASTPARPTTASRPPSGSALDLGGRRLGGSLGRVVHALPGTAPPGPKASRPERPVTQLPWGLGHARGLSYGEGTDREIVVGQAGAGRSPSWPSIANWSTTCQCSASMSPSTR